MDRSEYEGLVAGLAQETEHILLICFYAGLIEGIDAEDVTGNGTSLLEEVYHISEILFICAGHLKDDIGNTAVAVSVCTA